MSERRLQLAAIAALFVGVGLMVPFEHTGTLLAGVICLFAFIVLGTFAVANPEDLSRDDSDD